MTPQLLRELGEHARRAADRAASGRVRERTTCPSSSGGSQARDYTLRGVNLRVREVELGLLADVDSPDALSALEEHLAALDEQRA